MLQPAFEKTLMALWLENKLSCRPVGDIVADARAGRLEGVARSESGSGFKVFDEKAALAAMRKA